MFADVQEKTKQPCVCFHQCTSLCLSWSHPLFQHWPVCVCPCVVSSNGVTYPPVNESRVRSRCRSSQQSRTSRLTVCGTPPPLTSAKNRTRKWLFQDLISTRTRSGPQLVQHACLCDCLPLVLHIPLTSGGAAQGFVLK